MRFVVRGVFSGYIEHWSFRITWSFGNHHRRLFLGGTCRGGMFWCVKLQLTFMS
ncbi:unnamed protein product [Brassica rapa subsp. trilocularis]